MQIIDGRKIAQEILEKIKQEVSLLDFTPIFCDVLVGDNLSSKKYVEMKAKKAEELGIKFQNANFPGSITTNELVEEIRKLNKIQNMCGIIVQLPLPNHIDEQKVLDAINPAIDVDALGSVVSERFYSGRDSMKLPTALACHYILKFLNLDLHNKKIVILGQGKLVGKPVTKLLEIDGLSPIPVRSTTLGKEELLKNADIVIAGIGRGHYLKGDMVKEGVVIIDAGTSESGSVLIGDVDSQSVGGKASYLSPCPGGVGPVTVAMLFRNVLEVAKHKQNDTNK